MTYGQRLGSSGSSKCGWYSWQGAKGRNAEQHLLGCSIKQRLLQKDPGSSSGSCAWHIGRGKQQHIFVWQTDSMPMKRSF